MAFVHIYSVAEHKLPIWFFALTHTPFDIRFNVGKREGVARDNISFVYVRDIQVFVETTDQLDFIENYVSHMCYFKGYIQTPKTFNRINSVFEAERQILDHAEKMDKKENSHVREADRQVPEKVCPSTGEAC